MQMTEQPKSRYLPGRELKCGVSRAANILPRCAVGDINRACDRFFSERGIHRDEWIVSRNLVSAAALSAFGTTPAPAGAHLATSAA